MSNQSTSSLRDTAGYRRISTRNNINHQSVSSNVSKPFNMSNTLSSNTLSSNTLSSHICNPDTNEICIHKFDNFDDNFDDNDDDNLDNDVSSNNTSTSDSVSTSSDDSNITDSYQEQESDNSTLIGDMKADIRSIVSMLDALNKSVTNTNDEIRNMKRDISKLIDENAHLKKRIAKIKENRKSSSVSTADKVISVINNNESVLPPINDVKIIKRDRNNDINTEALTKTHIKIVKHTNTADSDSVISDESNISNISNVSNVSNISSVYVDSQMNKRATLFKTAPPRTKNSTADVFGVVEQKSDTPTYNSNFRQKSRQDAIESKEKIQVDTGTSRAKRLNLQTTCQSNGTSNKPACKRI